LGLTGGIASPAANAQIDRLHSHAPLLAVAHGGQLGRVADADAERAS